jgi:hypothetical protein
VVGDFGGVYAEGSGRCRLRVELGYDSDAIVCELLHHLFCNKAVQQAKG